jgi:hypothetical protein
MVVLGWLCLGFGIAFSVPDLIKIGRRNWPGTEESARAAARNETWRSLRHNLMAAGVGLAILGSHKNGALSWAYGVPLLTLVTLNTALWLRTRIRTRMSRATS